MTALAQGEQGRAADNRGGGRPVLRGWLHVVAFCGWLIGGPFLIAAGPDRRCQGGALRLRGGHARDVRHQRGLPPTALVGAGVAPHAAGRPQRDLRRDRGDVHGGGRSRAHRVGPGDGARHGLGRSRRGRRVAPGVARRAAAGGRHPLRGGGLVPDRRRTPTGARPRVGGLLAHDGGGPWPTRRGRSPTPASGPTRGRGSSVSTRCSTCAPWWARGCSRT